jgi:hypothetical protein
MNKIYKIIGDLRDVYIGISLQYTRKKYEAEDAVSMLMEYFMQMNKETLSKIYKTDGRDGLIKYGAVALRRSFTSPRSKFYYIYKRYDKILDDGGNHKKQFYTEDETVYNKKRVEDIAYNTDITTWYYFEEMDKVIDSLYWYDREVYKLYYNVDKKETLDSLAKKTGISRNSLFTTLDNVRKQLKKVLLDE